MKIFKAAAEFFLQMVICLLIFETGAYFFLQYSGNALYRTRRVLQADSEFGWISRKNLQTSFERKKLSTDDRGYRGNHKEGDLEKFELLTLGPSSAFGWGAEATETYSAIVSQELALPSINASQIGYSIVQGRRLWKKNFNSLPHHPQYVLLAFGINDLDKFRFYTDGNMADEEFFKKTPLVFSPLVRAEENSYFLTLLSLAYQEFKLRKDCVSLSVIEQRVSLTDYQNQLEKLLEDFARLSIQPILVNTPYFLKNPNSLYSLEKINKNYELVKMHALNNDCEKALEFLSEAKQLEPDRISNDVAVFNRFLKEYAFKKGILYIDAQEVLSTDSVTLNYVDPVHPSARGHKLIALGIINAILKNNNGKTGK